MSGRHFYELPAYFAYASMWNLFWFTTAKQPRRCAGKMRVCDLVQSKRGECSSRSSPRFCRIHLAGLSPTRTFDG